ncbi:MAG: SMP-30/gluconolactonase/LRE family protein [Nitrospinota bacterium]|nr:SMP-30/gluconolactonase/LRE family protein [Nitrospinota bacterium]
MFGSSVCADLGQVYPLNKNIGDGKKATEAILTLVDGLAIDREGGIYISHRSKNRIRKIGKDGIITTLAGNGTAGFSGDGGPAWKASFNFPAGLCLDGDGNLFVADRNNHRVRRIDPAGTVTTVAGTGDPDMGGDGGPAVQAHLNYPSDLVCDDHGNLYISDRSNNRIRKVNAKGIISTIVGMGLPDFGGDFGPAVEAFLKYPFGIDMDSKGNLYIADRGNNRIRKVDTQGIITTVAGDGTHFFAGDYGPATRASLAYPTDVVADDRGNLYIADRNNNRIRKVDSLGIITTVMGIGKYEYNGDNEIASETTLHLPFAVALSPDGKLIIVDRNHFRVRSMDLKSHTVATVAGNGKSWFRGDGGPGPGATLEFPSGIGVGSRGRVIFSDKMANRLRFIDQEGFIYSFAGNGNQGNEGDGGPAIEASLYLPNSLVVDQKDNIYFVSPQGNSQYVRKIDSQGNITRFAGNGILGDFGDGGPAVQASFGVIQDLAVDVHGNIYIADLTNRKIRKVDTQGIVSTLASDNWKDIADEEIHPNGIAVNSSGEIFVSDSGSSKIRKIDRDQKITVFAGSGEFKDSGDGGPAVLAGIRSPGGLAFSPVGELFIAEETSHRIRKIDKAGNIFHVAGTGNAGYEGDGGVATQASLKSPYRLAFDKEGNLYFSDRDNHRIRKIDSRGIITTVAGNSNIGWLQDGLEVRITVHNFP